MFRLTPVFVLVATIAFSTSVHCCFAQEGSWDAQLDSPGGPIRFGLKLEKLESNQWNATLTNGNEEIEVPRVSESNDGHIVLSIDHYDSQLSLALVPKTDTSDAFLAGSWKKRRKKNKWVKLGFRALSATNRKLQNFENPSKFDGRWDVKFSSSDVPAVGVFKSDPKTGRIGGTFLTTTGDYRFLAGTATDGEMELSCFDGAHAFLFKAKLNEDGSLSGDFWSSNTWHETWTATRNENASIDDGFQLTKAVEANINALSFPDLEGNEMRLDDEQYSAPVRIVHIFGSWCPNCHDAAKFLSELEIKYGKDISVVGIAFELTGDFDRDVKQVRKYLQRNKLDHPVLIGGGSSSKDLATKAIKIVDEVRSYPTTIFADSSGKIVAVHQGFSGPATGESFTALKKKFEATIEEIRNR